ncbi:MAG: GspH/FimT family pseudopilin [Pseudomonadota bacterium]
MSPAGSADASPQSGMTLLEVLIVVTILGLGAAALPLSSFSAIDTARFDSLGRALMSELGRTRARALSSGNSERFILDVSARRFGKGLKQSLPADVDVRYTATKQSGLSSQSGAIVFYPDGSASGGSLALTQGNRRQRITVDWITGEVTRGG